MLNEAFHTIHIDESIIRRNDEKDPTVGLRA